MSFDCGIECQKPLTEKELEDLMVRVFSGGGNPAVMDDDTAIALAQVFGLMPKGKENE